MTVLQTDQLLRVPPPVRVPTGIKFLDDTLGGGYIAGTVILVTGLPGTGKTSLMMKAAPCGTIYNNNEESAASLAYKAHLLGLDESRGITWVLDKNLRGVFALAEEKRPPVLVVDSLQETNVTDPAAVSEACHYFAEATGTTVFLVGHVNAKGAHFGAQRVRHWVDIHLHLVDREEFEVLKDRFQLPRLESSVEEPEDTLLPCTDTGISPSLVSTPRAPQQFTPTQKVWMVLQATLMVLIAIVAFPILLAGLVQWGSKRI